jgi:hypothetical protein
MFVHVKSGSFDVVLWSSRVFDVQSFGFTPPSRDAPWEPGRFSVLLYDPLSQEFFPRCADDVVTCPARSGTGRCFICANTAGLDENFRKPEHTV